MHDEARQREGIFGQVLLVAQNLFVEHETCVALSRLLHSGGVSPYLSVHLRNARENLRPPRFVRSRRLSLPVMLGLRVRATPSYAQGLPALPSRAETQPVSPVPPWIAV